MSRKTVCSIALVCAVALPTVLVAQPKDKSGGFFDKNFAETPLKRREGGKFPDGSFPTPRTNSPFEMQDQNGDSPVSQEQLNKMLKDSMKNGDWQREMGAGKPTPRPMREEQNSRDLTGLMRPIQVRSIGGIINSLDPEHYQRSLQQLTDLAVSRDLEIGTIYTIGDMKIASDTPLMGKVMARGGVVHIVSNIPQGYDVSLSPTWIVKTDEGEILLEAVGGLEKFFNQQGQFLDREKREQKADTAKPS